MRYNLAFKMLVCLALLAFGGWQAETACAQTDSVDPVLIEAQTKLSPEMFPLPAIGETRKNRFTSFQRHGYDIPLEKGEFLDFTVEAIGAGVILEFADPAGKILESFFSPVGLGAKTDMRIIAAESGMHRIILIWNENAIAPDERKGQYALVITKKNPATRSNQASTLEWKARKIVTADIDTRPAIPLCQQGLELFRELGDLEGQGDCLLQMGRAYLYADLPENASAPTRQSLAIFETLKAPKKQIRSLNILGIIHTETGEYHLAVEYLKQATQLCQSLNAKFQLADTLVNLARLYELLGNDTTALEVYQKSLALFEELKASVYVTDIRLAIGTIQDRLGNTREALVQLLAIREVQLENGDQNLLARFDLHIGTMYLKLHDLKNATDYARRTKTRALTHQFPGLVSRATQLEGLIRLEEGKYAEAIDLLKEARRISDASGLKVYSLEFQTNQAEAEYRRGHFEDALTLISEAVETTESQRGAIDSSDLRASFLGSVQSRYELYTAVLMAMHRRAPQKSVDAQAFLVSERAKARTLIDILRTKTITVGGDKTILSERRKLQKRINAGNQVLLGLSNSADDVKRRADLEKELATAVEEYRDLTTRLQKLNPKFVRLTEPVALDLREIRAQLDDHTVLLEYSLGTEKSYLWSVTKTGLRSFELPGRAQIESLARKTYAALTARGQIVKYEHATETAVRIAQADREYAAVSKELGHLLLGQVAPELDGKQVIVVGDGALLYLPFAALPLPDSGQPLVTACEVTQLPSISTLSALRQDTADRPRAPQTVAIFADPVFSAADTRVRSGPTVTAAPNPELPDDATRAVSEIDGAERDSGLSRLPFTRREAEAIGALVPEGQRRVVLDFKANRDAVFNADLSRFRFVHFATHGFVNSATPDLSGVVLSMVNEKGEPQDGFVHAYEIFNLKLPVEMVVLSACRTGLGKEIRGEGMIGLTRAFLYAGAERVLVSHWSVRDAATSTLMADTYAAILQKNQRPAAALRAAQLKMRKDPRWAHPYYWAAFTLQGEPR